MTLPSLSSFRHVVSACGGTKLRPLSQPSYSPQLTAFDGQPLRPLSHPSFRHIVFDIIQSGLKRIPFGEDLKEFERDLTVSFLTMAANSGQS
jgi:hypothetical protein